MQLVEDSALAGNPAAVHRCQPQTGEQTRNKQTRGQWPQEHLVGEPELRLSLHHARIGDIREQNVRSR
jgi:hypothetical protein